MDGRADIELVIHVFGSFYGWEIRITGCPGMEVRMRILQISENRYFNSDACMARKAGIWELDFVL
jgi:hypothetical protein